MILLNKDNGLYIIMQTDHARLSGQIGRLWGNESFEKPMPFDSVIIAADHHDDGWAIWEAMPEIDPATGIPRSFRGFDLEKHIDLFKLGVERVISEDCYSGALVAMHARQLYEWKRAGSQSSDVAAADARLFDEIFAWLDSQIRYADYRMIGDEFEFATNPTILQANFRLVRTWDAISLFLCEQRTDKTEINEVPTDYRGNNTTLSISLKNPNLITVDPYPLAQPRTELVVKMRRLVESTFDSDKSFREAVRNARIEECRFTLVPV